VLVFILATVIWLAPALRAVGVEQRPNFTGTWTLDAAKSSAVGGGRGTVDTPGGGRGGGLGLGPAADSVTITQTTETLTIDERRGTATSRIVYRLDSTSGVNVLAAGRNAGAKASSLSRWQGSRLVTTVTVATSPDVKQAITYEETRWLEPDGTMVVETRRPGEPNQRRSVYRAARQ